MDLQKTKKPFDKKKWRNERYNKKFQKQQFEDRRNKAIMRDYFKLKKKSIPNDSPNNQNGPNQSEQSSQPIKRLNAYQQAQQEFEKRKQDALARREGKLPRGEKKLRKQ
ncbi:hypothetical protein WDU94_005321 [Cyamophila willieti]